MPAESRPNVKKTIHRKYFMISGSICAVTTAVRVEYFGFVRAEYTHYHGNGTRCFSGGGGRIQAGLLGKAGDGGHGMQALA